MKKFKIIMKATSEKEVVLFANSEEDALTKLEKKYLDTDEIKFTNDDILEIENSCEVIEESEKNEENIKDISQDIAEKLEDILDQILDEIVIKIECPEIEKYLYRDDKRENNGD